MRFSIPSFVAVILALLAFSAAAQSAEPRNQEFLEMMISSVERASNLVCEKGREPGRLLNPLFCNTSTMPDYFPSRPSVCLGTVHYQCKDTAGKKQFRISATYRYVNGVVESMQKLKLSATN